jgi:hypothetical protein
MRTTFVTAVVLSLGLVGIPAAIHCQSLAEVAAKTRAQRKAEGGKPPKVITGDDLESGRRGAPPPDEVTTDQSEDSAQGEQDTGSAPTGQAASGAEKEKTDDEIRAEKRADWEKRQKAAEEKVAKLTEQLDSVQQELADFRYSQFGPGRTQKEKLRDELTAQLDAAKQELDNLEDERRREGY